MMTNAAQISSLLPVNCCGLSVSLCVCFGERGGQVALIRITLSLICVILLHFTASGMLLCHVGSQQDLGENDWNDGIVE